MAKTPTLTSGLTVSSPGVKSTPTSQMGLLGSLLERIGVKPLAQQLAEEQAQKDRAILSKDLDTQKGQTQLSQLGLGPISLSDDVQNFINQDAINKQRIKQFEEEQAKKNLSNVEGASSVLVQTYQRLIDQLLLCLLLSQKQAMLLLLLYQLL